MSTALRGASGPDSRTQHAEVLIADPSALRSSATARLVESLGHRVVSTVTTLPDLVRELHVTWPDVVVVGLGNAPSEWLHALQVVRELAPKTPVIACGGEHRALAMEAIRAGVSEYLIGRLDPERF